MDDSRIVGAFAISGGVDATQLAAVSHNTPASQLIAASTVVLAADVTRLKAHIEITAPCYIDSNTNGITMPAGLFEWVSQSALTLIPVAAAATVKILDTKTA